jgi:hypothetical protein
MLCKYLSLSLHVYLGTLGDGGRYLISCLQRLQLKLHVASWNFATRDRSDHASPFSRITSSPILLLWPSPIVPSHPTQSFSHTPVLVQHTPLPFPQDACRT